MKKIYNPSLATLLFTFASIAAHAQGGATSTSPAAPAAVAVGATPAAAAAPTAFQGQTTASPISALNNFTASVRVEGYGPAVTSLTAYRPNVAKGIENDPKSQIYSKNKLSLAYKLDPTWTTGVGLAFYTLSQTGNVFQEPYVFVRNSQLVHIGNFNLDLALRVYGGFTAASQKYSNAGQIRTTGDASYKISSIYTAGLIYEAYDYILSTVKVGARKLEFDLIPHFDARIAENAIASLLIKTYTYHNVGNGFINAKDPVYLSPNMTWLFASKSVAVNPYLDIPLSRFEARYTTIGLNLNWKIL